MATTQTREPEFFTAGDTLSFTRSLADYPAGAGWALEYALTDIAGTRVANVISTADGDSHKVYADNFAAGLDAGVYVLTGAAFLNSERHTIYLNQLTLQGNLPSGLATGSQKTVAQQMIELILGTLREIYASKFAETEVQRNRFKIADEHDALNSLKYWQEVRNNEIQWERARSGKATGMNQVPVFNIG